MEKKQLKNYNFRIENSLHKYANELRDIITIYVMKIFLLLLHKYPIYFKQILDYEKLYFL